MLVGFSPIGRSKPPHIEAERTWKRQSGLVLVKYIKMYAVLKKKYTEVCGNEFVRQSIFFSFIGWHLIVPHN